MSFIKSLVSLVLEMAKWFNFSQTKKAGKDEHRANIAEKTIENIKKANAAARSRVGDYADRVRKKYSRNK